MSTTQQPAPVAPAPQVPSAGITVSTAQNLATHLLFGVGAVLGAFGLTSAHSIWDAVTSSGFLGGALTSVLAAGISHLTVIGANNNTIAIADQILTKFLPQQQSLMQQVASSDPNAASQA